MRQPEEQDEQLHTAGSVANWRESYFFGFHDEVGRTGLTYISLSPNQGTIIRMIILLMPQGNQTLAYLQQGPLPHFEDTTLEQGSLRFRCLEPLRRWQLEAEVDCIPVFPGQEVSSALAAVRKRNTPTKHLGVAFDLDFQACMPPYRFPTGALDFLGQGQEHFEQMGQVVGRLRIGDEEFALTALGVRDHSWGTRDWLRMEWYNWLNLSFEDLFISAILSRTGGREESSGFVYQDGLSQPIVQVVVDAQRDPDDLHLLTGQVQIVAAGGQTLDLELAPLSFFHMFLAREGPWQNHDSLTLVTSRCGDQTGQGFLDYELREPASSIAPNPPVCRELSFEDR